MTVRNNGDATEIKIVNVVGARPNFMKIAPLMRAYASCPWIKPVLVHTGQHYDEKMSDLFFRELEIPAPDINLDVGSASHAVQTAQIMIAFEKCLLKEKPDAVLVVGDVNSTIACGIVAVKMGIKLIHVEAGLRSFDRTMPEEINRILTDSISDQLFCSEPSGMDNLLREGVAKEKIHLVGNVMIDTLRQNLQKAQKSRILEQLGLQERAYATLTMHRPSNVDDPTTLAQILSAVEVIQRDISVIFPCHPRTAKILENAEIAPVIRRMERLHVIEPVGYLDFLRLMSASRVVLSDSGGIQEETTALRVPCLTLRENTERPITNETGSSRLVGADPRRILEGYREFMAESSPQTTVPALWDGNAAARIVAILESTLRCSAPLPPADL